MTNRLRAVRANLGVAQDLFRYMWRRKWWWLVPLLVVLAILAVLAIIGTVTGLGPFIYTIF